MVRGGNGSSKTWRNSKALYETQRLNKRNKHSQPNRRLHPRTDLTQFGDMKMIGMVRGKYMPGDGKKCTKHHNSHQLHSQWLPV
jgi:hypothetical protein